MPFRIIKFDENKFKVCGLSGKCYSKHFLTYEQAVKQLRALYINYYSQGL